MRHRTRSFAPFLALILAGLAMAKVPAMARAGDPVPEAGEATPELSYITTLTIEGETEELRAAATEASRLFSLGDEPFDTMGVLFLRAREDEKRMRRALNALGYFGAKVAVAIEGEPVRGLEAEDRIAALPAGARIAVAIDIIPGPRFSLADITIRAGQGLEPGLPGQVTPPSIGLTTGAPARSADIVASQARAIDLMREAGHPFARLEQRKATANHETATLDVELEFDPGPKATFGTVSVTGTQRMDPEFVSGLAPFKSGDAFQTSLLKDFRDSVERLGVFDAVQIDEAGKLDAQGGLPLTVNVGERPLRAIGVAANWSTLEGAALTSYWEHRNLFGHAEKLRIEASAARLFLNALQDYEFALQGVVTLPAWPDRRDDVFVSAAARKERPDAYARDALELGLGWTRRFDRALAVEAGVALSRANEEDAFGSRSLTTITLPTAVLYDTRNDPLEPVRGLRASVELRPLVNLEDTENAATRMLAQAAAYVSIDEDARTVVAGRVAAGLSVGAGIADLPADLRFFAGGGGSVRGYAFQGLGPRDAADRIIGGASLAEASVEVRHWLFEDIGVALFADAGGAFVSDVPDFSDMGTGVGAGARYRTPVGPLRLDIAIPLDPRASDPDFSVYVGLGQAF